MEEEAEKAGKFGKNNSKIRVLTQEAIAEMGKEVSLADIDSDLRKQLEVHGVEELFQVQKSVYQLFLDGSELIVKSRTGTGKTLAFLLPLEKLIKDKS